MAQMLIGYETTLIMKPDSTDDQVKAFVEKLKGIITTHNGTVMITEDWGRRRFAYPIQKEIRGSYQHIVFAADNLAVAELERNMRINESVLRFLTVALGRDFKPADYKHRSIMTKPPVIGERPVGDRHMAEDSQY